MKTTATLFSLSLLCAAFQFARADEQPTTTVVDYGRYSATVEGRHFSPKTSRKEVVESRDLKPIEATKAIPCRLGETWGLRVAFSRVTSRSFRVRFQMDHPAIRQPDGSMLTRSVQDEIYQVGEDLSGDVIWHFVADRPEEMIPGDWTARVFVEDKEVVSVTFRVR